jgi:hypothetical protein
MSHAQTKIKWDDAAYVKLFLTILSVQEISVDYDKVSSAMGKLPGYPSHQTHDSPVLGLKKNILVQTMFKLRKRAKELGIESSGGGTGGGTFGDTKGRGRKKGSTTTSPAKKRKTKIRSEDDDVEVGFEEPGCEHEPFDEMDDDPGYVPVLSTGEVSASNHTSEPATPNIAGQTVLSGHVEKARILDMGTKSSGVEHGALRDHLGTPRPAREQTVQHQDHHGDQRFGAYTDICIKPEPRTWNLVEDDSPAVYGQPEYDTDGEHY